MADLRIVPLELSMVEELPHHSRVCAFWETDREPGHIERGYDDSFEKEAWLSAFLLEWGVCGQVLVADERAVGLVLYAPPNYIPRHKLLPSGPVNPDAMVLSHVYITDEYRSVMAYVRLINAAVADLRDRGVRAVEAFGREGDAGSYARDADTKSALDHLCIPTRDVLSSCGFKEIVPHPRVSRWRMDVDKRNLWQQSVKAALDQRYVDRMIELITYETERVPVGAGADAGAKTRTEAEATPGVRTEARAGARTEVTPGPGTATTTQSDTEAGNSVKRALKRDERTRDERRRVRHVSVSGNAE